MTDKQLQECAETSVQTSDILDYNINANLN